MKKMRNAVAIVILCLIGAYKAYKPAAPHLSMPPADSLRDAMADKSVKTVKTAKTIAPSLKLSPADDDQLHDSVAANPISEAAHHDSAPKGGTEDSVPPPPRGGDHSGIGPQSTPNPGSQLSPFAPANQ